MRTFWTMMLVIGVSVGCVVGCSKSGGSKIKRYGLESAIIEYELDGMQSGKETVWFDNWGLREAKLSDTQIRMMGFSQASKQLVLMENEWITTVNLKENQGTKMKNPFWERVMNRDNKDLSALGKELIIEMGGEKIGSGDVLGRACEIWEVKNLGSKSWIWNSIPLKTEVNFSGMRQVSTAVSIQENADVPEEKFQLASNVEIKEAPEKTMANIEAFIDRKN